MDTGRPHKWASIFRPRPNGVVGIPGEENEEPVRKETGGNFEALAKGLFRVTPAQFAAEEARQMAAKRKQPP